MPEGAIQARRDLQKVGLVNHAGEAPVLLDKRQVPDNPKITIWEFDICGIPLQEWLDQRDKIEVALDVIIVDIRWGERKAVPLRLCGSGESGVAHLSAVEGSILVQGTLCTSFR